MHRVFRRTLPSERQGRGRGVAAAGNNGTGTECDVVIVSLPWVGDTIGAVRTDFVQKYWKVPEVLEHLKAPLPQ